MPLYQWAVIEANLATDVAAEQKVKKPVLVVSNEEFNQALPYVTVLPLTTTKRSLYPSEVLLGKGKAGQSFESIIMAHQIRTIPRECLGRLFGYLNNPQLRQQVQEAIKEHMSVE